MNWDDLRFFTAVVQYQNLSRASKELCVSPQTVSRKITALETKLGTALFIRHPRGYKPTIDAMSLIDEVKNAEKTLTTLQNNFINKSKNFSGVVRIATPELIATEILLPSFKQFLDRHPEIDIELIVGVSSIGIAEGEADIALRLVRPERGALTIKKVGIMSSSLYAMSSDMNDLTKSKLVGWSSNIDLPSSKWLKKITGREPNLKFNNLATQKAAIQSGLGVGILPCFVAEGLKQIKQPYLLEESLWLVTHASNISTPRIRLVYDEITDIIVKNSSKLNGNY
ncbi:LysR family transcriptional regulator [Acinetobacter apis]|uniref:DNA-binding transcriptional regulator, LysR family n=1 Tax=Acinetobacter apis TaxID=1229165 RepID=A0A217EIL9_9GAMM|nr:LysR family transcriptional regulator [Acinetobacter apis]SNQ30264.1 DNA-binding transcriptional regulator, LysR family [Acinetobacter apis]